MKPLLMHKSIPFDPDLKASWNEDALIQDLGLDVLFEPMAKDDQFIFRVVKCALLRGQPLGVDEILYRQAALADCQKNPAVARRLYDLATITIEHERRDFWGVLARHPGMILSRSIGVLQMFLEALKEIRSLADQEGRKFSSEGFSAFFAMIQRELDDTYLATIEDHLKRLRFVDGVSTSAGLSPGLHTANFVLRKPKNRQRWAERLLSKQPKSYAFTIHPRDEAGAQLLTELRDSSVNLVANALAQSTDHILGFFKMLQAELAFYVGCLNLNRRLSELNIPTSFPSPVQADGRVLTAKSLYDISLALTIGRKAIPNDLAADRMDALVITGANQGGKTTFLRSIGAAQIMMQAGMFLPAKAFRANTATSIATHFKREEDKSMASGKFDEELARISAIIDHTSRDAFILFNESFSATNEREGSEIARQLFAALLDEHVKVAFVTHLYDFAHSIDETEPSNVAFLRAQRLSDGSRNFKIVPGEPLETSYGADLYAEVFVTGS